MASFTVVVSVQTHRSLHGRQGALVLGCQPGELPVGFTGPAPEGDALVPDPPLLVPTEEDPELPHSALPGLQSLAASHLPPLALLGLLGFLLGFTLQ